MLIAIVFFGFIFGFLMQHARVNRSDVITGMAVMKDWTAAKTMGLAIGVGLLLINLVVELGLASYHVKPVMMGGLVWGGLLFGFGMAVLGYCPGTLPISAGLRRVRLHRLHPDGQAVLFEAELALGFCTGNLSVPVVREAGP